MRMPHSTKVREQMAHILVLGDFIILLRKERFSKAQRHIGYADLLVLYEVFGNSQNLDASELTKRVV